MATVKKEGSKVYIEGVPGIGWGAGFTYFAASLSSCMKVLGEDIPYHFIMGTSGAAFRLKWRPERWQTDCGGFMGFDDDEPHGPYRRAIEAIGYEFVTTEPGNKEDDIRNIMSSIDAGIPVIGFGFIGPPEAGVIAGYDDGGEVLLGWSYYPDVDNPDTISEDPTGYLRKRSWHECVGNENMGYIFIKGKKERPPLRQIYVDALEWAVKYTRTPMDDGIYNGLAAYKAWADEIIQDRFFPAEDQGVISDRYLSIAYHQMWLVERGSTAKFLRQIAEDESDLAPELIAAADCYAEILQLHEDSNKVIKPDFSEEAIKQVSDPAIRRIYSLVLLKMRDKEEEAIGHIERCLGRIGAVNIQIC